MTYGLKLPESGEIELLQIERIKMQAWVKEVGESVVLIFEVATPRVRAESSGGSRKT